MDKYILQRLELESEYYSLSVNNNHLRMDFPDSSIFYLRRRDFKYSLTNQSSFSPLTIVSPTPFNLEFDTFEGTNVVANGNIVLITLQDGSSISVESNSGNVTVYSDNKIFASFEYSKLEDKSLTNKLLQKWRDSKGKGNVWVFNVIPDGGSLTSTFRMSMKVITKYYLGGAIFEDFSVGEYNVPVLSNIYQPPNIWGNDIIGVNTNE